MIQKLTAFKITNAAKIVGGEESDTERRKSADKMHNKITQLMQS
ncbi:hypothetical protein C8N46_11195 [Kordia periserrulae]|uniref:Uncharacterized protein n=1 Tax=Kordia periserrulae TaxID=701523 RepID=A0A2T6BSM6_9FLAO|nr:hypothetical protein [Kordia periserrulae]PTX59026.1 hypothetical protein C8N46_11195 [Kordia periserrulae]